VFKVPHIGFLARDIIDDSVSVLKVFVTPLMEKIVLPAMLTNH